MSRSLSFLALFACAALTACSASDEASTVSGTSDAPVASDAAAASAASSAASSADTATATGAATGAASASSAPAVQLTDHSIVLGDPDAKHRVSLFEDFYCPHCLELHEVMDAQGAVQAWIDAGAAVEIVPVNYLGPRTTHKFSEHAASALALVADKYPEQVLPAQAALFGVRPGTTTEELAPGVIAEALKDAGVPLTNSDDLDSYADFVQAATDFSAQDKVTGVPELRVDGKAVDGETPEELVVAVAAALGAE